MDKKNNKAKKMKFVCVSKGYIPKNRQSINSFFNKFEPHANLDNVTN